MQYKNGDCIHVVLFGTPSESRYFLEPQYKDKFDLIGFNANVVVFYPDAVASFISQLANKSFFIDPQVYAFQQRIRTIMRKGDSGLEVKASVRKLADQYGNYISERTGKEPINPAELTPKILEEISQAVLFFQLNFIGNRKSLDDLKEFLSESDFQPTFLIAPYLYLEPDHINEELSANINFINFSKDILVNQLKVDKKLFAEIVLSKYVLFDDSYRTKIINDYQKANVDGFILWIDDFSETVENEEENDKLLLAYKELLLEIGKLNKPVINLHGGYLSIILAGKSYQLLAGVGHGIEYGESRPVVPVGGGVPTAKFYFPKFHKRIDYNPDTVEILTKENWVKNSEIFYKNVCACTMCKTIINQHDNITERFQEYGKTKLSEKNGRAYPTAEALDKSRKHYLNNKFKEYAFCKSMNKDQILKELKINYESSKRLREIHSFDHLKKWYELLK